MRNLIFFRNMLGQKKICTFQNIETKLKISSLHLKNDLKQDLFSLYKFNNYYKK